MSTNRNDDVQRMIEILKDAADRSDEASPNPRQFSERRELALIYDFISANLIRGEVIEGENGPPIGAAMWGIKLAGREYLARLVSEREQASWKARTGKLLWAGLGVLVGVVVSALTAVTSAVALKLFALE